MRARRRLELWAASALVVLVVLAALAALLRGGGSADTSVELVAGSEPGASATATTTPTPTPTASPTASLSPSPTATPSPTPTATPTPTPTKTAEPEPTIEARPASVGNGETLEILVTAPGATGATAQYRGGSYRLARDGSSFWGVFAVPLLADAGPAEVTVTLSGPEGTAFAPLVADYEIVHVDRPVDEVTLTEDEASVLTPEASAQNAAVRAEQFAAFDPEPRWSGTFLVPTQGVLTSPYGVGRSYNGAPISSYHGGMDYANEEGTPIVAAAAGRVSWVGAMPIHGNTVIVDHGGGVKTGYHHLSEIDVEVDSMVEAGELVGLMGATGLVTGPHLHFELTVWGVTVDPTQWYSEPFAPPPAPADEPAG